ncbi:LysR substrate-binding domain-containing protein [Novosphingobium album (ex Liu et al. 2023)]|uniref:LysR substrate-binding domain-containing protein n=1 Tax=Novosphingobium album (ex Liu et al. 2023) TaxID=3031130 RepID=A0ABT5WXH6_9SPHN|nr:LysR substrate-binding domain-containing protein [Novosphingobium album (ex Liu et al. 2023)]MDE8654609.1 LysR substrate-binding domain-containing protein [Novosphingobium album (ex Liu et al. 2023)]
MRFRELECFRSLMLHGTVTRVAELLGLSQPAVSGIVAGLERQLGFQLFTRRAGRLHPTPEAHLLHVEASRILDAAGDFTRVAEQIRIGKYGHLAIAAYPSISISLLPRVLSIFTADRPGLQVKIITRNSQGIRSLFTSQQFDFAIAELPLDYPATHMDVFSYCCECMMAPDHPLTELEVITPKDLDNVPFVTLFRGDPVYQQLANAFSQYGSRWNIVAETEFFSSACELVAAGCGVGIIDPVISTPFTEHIVKRPFAPDISYEIAILRPTHTELSQIATDFIELLKTHLTP